jgi:pantothenate kinase
MIKRSLAEAVARAAALSTEGRKLLGITGCPGAGKSTLASAIHAAVPGSVVVPMDGFHMLNQELERLGRRNRKGAPDTFDVDAYVRLLTRVRAQVRSETVRAPSYDRLASAPVPDSIVVEAGIGLVVTEGNYLLLDSPPWNAVHPLLDEVWFVETDDAVRIPRLIARHVHFGKTPEQAREWVMRSDQANAVLVASLRERADVIVRMP